MGRRRTGLAGWRPAEARASIGDTHVENAITALNSTMQKAVSTMVTYDLTRETTLEMLFDASTLVRAANARGIVRPSTEIMGYAVGKDMVLGIDYSHCNTAPIMIEAMAIQPSRYTPLFNTIEAVRAIYHQYEEVKAVLRWLNRNATPGAIRYYWPQALQLCPHSTAFADLQDVPTRYNEPPNVSDWLQPMRDTANTLAASALLPSDATRRKRNTLWLTFNPAPVQRGAVEFKTDEITFNI